MRRTKEDLICLGSKDADKDFKIYRKLMSPLTEKRLNRMAIRLTGRRDLRICVTEGPNSSANPRNNRILIEIGIGTAFAVNETFESNYLRVQGLLAHECGHVLFSDFELIGKVRMDERSAANEVPNYAEKLDPENSEQCEILYDLIKEMIKKRVEAKLFNSLEDAAIENAMYESNPETYGALIEMREFLLKNEIDSLKRYVKMLKKNKWDKKDRYLLEFLVTEIRFMSVVGYRKKVPADLLEHFYTKTQREEFFWNARIARLQSKTSKARLVITRLVLEQLEDFISIKAKQYTEQYIQTILMTENGFLPNFNKLNEEIDTELAVNVELDPSLASMCPPPKVNSDFQLDAPKKMQEKINEALKEQEKQSNQSSSNESSDTKGNEEESTKESENGQDQTNKDQSESNSESNQTGDKAENQEEANSITEDEGEGAFDENASDPSTQNKNEISPSEGDSKKPSNQTQSSEDKSSDLENEADSTGNEAENQEDVGSEAENESNGTSDENDSDPSTQSENETSSSEGDSQKSSNQTQSSENKSAGLDNEASDNEENENDNPNELQGEGDEENDSQSPSDSCDSKANNSSETNDADQNEDSLTNSETSEGNSEHEDDDPWKDFYGSSEMQEEIEMNAKRASREARQALTKIKNQIELEEKKEFTQSVSEYKSGKGAKRDALNSMADISPISDLHEGCKISIFRSDKFKDRADTSEGKEAKGRKDELRKLAIKWARPMKQLLMYQGNTSIRKGLSNGSLNRSGLYRAKTDLKVFKKKTLGKEKKARFCTLIDCSGSMSGDKMVNAIKAAYMLGEACKSIQVPISIYGHTTNSERGVNLFECVSYDDNKNRNCLDTLFKLSSDWGNRDGLAMFQCLTEMVRAAKKDEILIFLVISDGWPTYHNASTEEAALDMQVIIDKFEETYNVKTIGVGIGSECECVCEIYKNALIVPDVGCLGDELLKILKNEVLD